MSYLWAGALQFLTSDVKALMMMNIEEQVYSIVLLG